ncbi:hypothetical protein [Lacticaseibacillus paracasei]|uniref:hypothetical protein n=1 Tax=Lacticaseibacillus paracasei TaxID=1597 RepID=UPI001865BD6A|nr:hypothetical protein [Lacticaseibacillus paracasei]
MNYFNQRRAFRQFKVAVKKLTVNQASLYRELLDYANDSGLLDASFRLQNDYLKSLTGIKSDDGLSTARNVLVQQDLLVYVKGKKNEDSPIYQIVPLNPDGRPLSEKRNSLREKTEQNAEQNTEQNAGKPAEQNAERFFSITENDLSKTKTPPKSPQKDTSGLSTAEEFATEVWPAYPKKQGNYATARETYVQAIESGEATKEQVLAKIAEYKAYIELNGIGDGYVMSGGNWFAGHGWHNEYNTKTPEKGNNGAQQKGRQESYGGLEF